MENENLTPVWKALSDPARRRILDMLLQRPRTTGEISSEFEFSRYAAMKHLGVLHDAGLIFVRREGRRRWNHLNPVPLERIYRRWLRPYEPLWAGTLIELRDYAERTHRPEEPMNDPRGLPKTGNVNIELEIKMAAPREKVFEALTGEIGMWWPYRVRKELAKELVLEPVVGGRFYESWGGDEGILWGTVHQIKRGERLDLVGQIGMARLAHSFVTFVLEDDSGGTLVKLSHRGIGEMDEEVQQNYTQGWQHLMENAFRNWVEKGERPEIQG